jgi:HNH endonuclease
MSLTQRRRFAILERDDFHCRYCGRSAPRVVLNVDHIVPRSRGGSDDDSNLVSACATCNSGKSARTISPPGSRIDQFWYREMLRQWLIESFGDEFDRNTDDDAVARLAELTPWDLGTFIRAAKAWCLSRPEPRPSAWERLVTVAERVRAGDYAVLREV